MKQFRKAVTLLFLTAVFVMFTECEDDIEITETQQSFRVVTFKELPAAIQFKITTAEHALKSSAAHKENKPFGTVVPTKIHRRLKPDGSASYTLGITRTSKGLYYDNLVINRDAGGNLKTHIIRYQPEALWFYQHKTAGLGYEAYSGVITVFNEAGGLLSSVNLISGEMEKEAAKITSSKANAAGCEILDVEYVGGCAGEDYCWWNEIIITVDCTGTGGGTGGYEEDDGLNDGVNDPGGEEGGGAGPGGGGAGSNGGPGDPIDTVPVEDNEEEVEEEEQIVIDSTFVNNPCLMAVYDSIGGAATFKNYLENFDGDFSVANLTFRYDEDFSQTYDPQYWNALAITNPPQNSNIFIDFNGDVNLSSSIHNKPQLVIAVAFIHEVIHAEIFRKMLYAAQNDNLNPGTMTQEEQENYVNNLRNNFPGLYDYYIDR